MPIEHYVRTLGLGHVPVIHPAIFYDDCQGAFNYIIEGTGDSYAASYEAEAAMVGKLGLRLETRTINQAINDYVQITKRLHLSPTKLLRIQFVFTHYAATPSSELIIYLHWFTGEQEYLAGLTFQQSVAAVLYWGAAPAWVAIPDVTYIKGPLSWNSVDLTIDLANNLYSHLLLNEYALDLKAFAIPFQADPAEPKRADLAFSFKTTVADTARLYLDQILITPEAL